MRLSSRLLRNAATTYARVAATCLLGIFFVWYVVDDDQAGMVGFGMIAFAATASGLSAAVQEAVRQSLMRELAAAVATGAVARVRKSLTSAVVLCVPAALLLSLVGAAVAALAYFGVFNTPLDVPGLRLALAILLLAEGLHTSVRLAYSPYTQGLLAAQHVGTDNVWVGLDRLTNPLAAIVVFEVVLPRAALAVKLIGFAVARGVLQILHIALGVWLAKWRVPGLQFQRSAVDRAEFRSIAGTMWHTGQYMLLMGLNVRVLAILINLFFGMTYNGIWQIVVQVGSYTRMGAQALLHGVEPLATHLHHEGRRAAIVDLMVRTVRYQVGVLLPVMAGLAIFVHPLMKLWIAGQIARDPHLAQAGITVAAAIDLIAVMIWIYLAAELARTSMFGVERILYGVGEIRSYSWCAKYAATMNVVLAALLMWIFDDPVVAPVSLVVVNLLFYTGVVVLAAIRRLGLPIGGTLVRGLPWPLLATAILCVPLLLVRTRLDELTLLSLVAVAAGAGSVYGVLFYTMVLEPDERARIRELLRRRGDARLGH